MTPYFLDSSVIYYDLISWLYSGCLKNLTWQVSGSLDISWQPVIGRFKCSDLNLLFVCFAARCFCSSSLTENYYYNFLFFFSHQNQSTEEAPEAQIRMQLTYLREECPICAVVKTSWLVVHSCLNVVTLYFHSSCQGPQTCQKRCVVVKY